MDRTDGMVLRMAGLYVKTQRPIYSFFPSSSPPTILFLCLLSSPLPIPIHYFLYLHHIHVIVLHYPHAVLYKLYLLSSRNSSPYQTSTGSNMEPSQIQPYTMKADCNMIERTSLARSTRMFTKQNCNCIKLNYTLISTGMLRDRHVL